MISHLRPPAPTQFEKPNHRISICTVSDMEQTLGTRGHEYPARTGMQLDSHLDSPKTSLSDGDSQPDAQKRPTLNPSPQSSASLWAGSTAVGSPSPASSKKRLSSLTKFLTLKEPSQDALRQYEEHLRKQQSRGPISPAGMSMVSSQQLPEHVPKVNSKWDGVPDSVKRRQRDGALSSSSLKKSAGTDDASSLNSRSSGRSWQSRRQSRAWSSIFGGSNSEDQRPSWSRQSDASPTEPKEPSLSNSTKGSTLASRRLSHGSTASAPTRPRSPAPRLARSPNMVFPSLDRNGSFASTPAYTSPKRPPPVPPPFVEDASGEMQPNPLLRPKNSDGTLMRSHEERLRESQSAYPQVLVESYGPEILRPPTPPYRRGFSPSPGSNESTPQSILKRHNSHLTVRSGDDPVRTPSRSPLRASMLPHRPKSPSGHSDDEAAAHSNRGPEPSTASPTANPKTRKGLQKLNPFRVGG